jgi:hypothetical protein
MNSNKIETQQALATESTSTKRKPAAKKANAVKKAPRAKKAASNPSADRANKKADVIAHLVVVLSCI